MDKGNWTYRKLGEICEVQNGLWTGKKPPFVKVGVIRNINFTKDCTLDDSDIFFTDVEEKAYKKRKLLKGDIIIEKSGGSEKQPVGRPILFDLDGEYSFSNFTSVLRLNTNELTPSFLHKALVGLYFQGKTRPLQSKTTGIHNLDFNKFLQFSIPIPPLPIQQRIVAELDCISSILEKKRQQLKELDNLAQAIFYDMFGDPDEIFIKWNYLTLEEVCLNIVDCPHTTPIKSETLTKYPCIRTSELKGGTIHWETMQYVNEDEYKKRVSRLVPQNGDIVYGREGSFGDAVILPQGWQFCLGQRTMLFRVNTNYVNTIFLHRVLISEVVLRQAKDKNVASTVAHVNVKDIKKFLIPLPPLALQQSFAAKIEAIEKQKERISQSIKEVQTLFDSRMEVYFG